MQESWVYFRCGSFAVPLQFSVMSIVRIAWEWDRIVIVCILVKSELWLATRHMVELKQFMILLVLSVGSGLKHIIDALGCCKYYVIRSKQYLPAFDVLPMLFKSIQHSVYIVSVYVCLASLNAARDTNNIRQRCEHTIYSFVNVLVFDGSTVSATVSVFTKS